MEAWQVQGVWWLPGAPDRKLFGSLSCNDEGELRLSLMGSFADGGAFGAMRMHILGGQQTKILGVVSRENGSEEVTLQDCFVTKESHSQGELGNKQEFFAHRAFLGAHLTTETDSLFHSASLTFSGLSAWAASLTGFSIEDSTPMAWKYPEMLPNGTIASGTFLLGIGSTSSGTKRKKTFEEEVRINFTFANPINESYLSANVIYPFQNFFSFATDVPNAMSKLIVSREPIPTDRISVFGPTTFADESATNELLPYQTLFSLEDVRDRLERVFGRWLEVSVRFERALVVYFACLYRPAGYTDLRFQQLMNVVCLYYSSKFATSDYETSLERDFEGLVRDGPQRSQLKAILVSHPLIWAEHALVELLKEHQKEMTPLVTDKDGRGTTEFIRYAINTLSYTNSRKQPSGPFGAEGGDLHWLSERLAFIIKVSLLKELEFSQEQIAMILGRNPQYRHMVQNIQPITSWM